jgi:hypothetical protein
VTVPHPPSRPDSTPARTGRETIALVRRYGAAVLPFAVLVAVIATIWPNDQPAVAVKTRDVHAWPRPGTMPLPDARAAALVTRTPETVPGNAKANHYVPARTQIAAFRAARNADGQSNRRSNPRSRYVTARPGLHNPSTDALIQWVSHKWRIPTDWIRAQLVVESGWRQGFLGDPEGVPSDWYLRYPAFARIAGGDRVYQSLGIAQVKWMPDGSVGAGTEPLRWRSTAFNLDYYAATIRYYYDGACRWCGHGYSPGQAWNSIGAWYSPRPWANADAQNYVLEVQRVLRNRSWNRLEQ